MVPCRQRLCWGDPWGGGGPGPFPTVPSPPALQPGADVCSSPWPRALPHCQELISGCSALQGKKKKNRKKGFGLLSLGEMSRMI